MCCYAPQRSKEMRERAHPPNTFRFCFMQQKSDITNSGMRPPCAAEHSAVNRSVVGSSPTGGVHTARKLSVYGLFSLDAKTFSKNKNFYIFETHFNFYYTDI